MLKRLRLHNFKTFLNFEVELTRRHLLIGKNNSGKTNLCGALRFLGATATSDYESAVTGIPGGAEGFCHWGLDPAKAESRVAEFGCTCEMRLGEEDLRYDYTLSLRFDKQGYTSPIAQNLPRTVREQLQVSGRETGQAVLLESDGETARLLDETGGEAGRLGTFIESAPPSDGSLLSKVYEQNRYRLVTQFKRAIGSISYYALSAPVMRHGWQSSDQNQAVTSREGLSPYGHNLPLALFQLKNEDEPRYRRVISYLGMIEPDIDSINFFVTPDNKPVPYLIMKGGRGQRASWDTLSDGSLCVLALGVIFQQSERLQELPGWPTSLCLLEEPENSLYRGLLPTLWEELAGAASSSQFLITTHSPYFIDLFDRDLAAVTRLKREGSITTARSLRDSGERIRQYLPDFSLGEMHYREILE